MWNAPGSDCFMPNLGTGFEDYGFTKGCEVDDVATSDAGRSLSSFTESIGGARAAVPPYAALVATAGLDRCWSKRVGGLVRC
jgi:hypothetical protein